MRQVQYDLRKLPGADPKTINKMKKLNDKQLQNLKDEQLR